MYQFFYLQLKNEGFISYFILSENDYENLDYILSYGLIFSNTKFH